LLTKFSAKKLLNIVCYSIKFTIFAHGII
jgi:hypothetical protein